jgi:hypothetical protein
MSGAKIVAGLSSVILLLVGLLGSAVSVLAIIDPVGTKAADDNDPFGTPPSLLGSLLMLLIFLCVSAVGVFLAWTSVRERRLSA